MAFLQHHKFDFLALAIFVFISQLGKWNTFGTGFAVAFAMIYAGYLFRRYTIYRKLKEIFDRVPPTEKQYVVVRNE